MAIALITGGNKGLGYETARRLIALGHTVYIGCRDEARGHAAAAALGAEAVLLDVTKDDSVTAAAALLQTKAGTSIFSSTTRASPACRTPRGRLPAPIWRRCLTRTSSAWSG